MGVGVERNKFLNKLAYNNKCVKLHLNLSFKLFLEIFLELENVQI